MAWDGERERAAEVRARRLMRDVAGPANLALYEELGFLTVERQGEYGYVLYPHRPIVVFDAPTGEPLGEWCVRFRDEDEALPAADDVLAKWLALQGDERGLASRANVSPLGTQIDAGQVRRDLMRLRDWRAASDRTVTAA
jgi:hypothetical protein